MKDNERLGYLDSIRGIAACLVVLYHCWLANTTGTERLHGSIAASLGSFSSLPSYAAGIFFESSRFAIIVFFVLSGFVLAYSLIKRPTPYTAYVVRRIFRIYPAFLFVILASYFLHSYIRVQHTTSSGWLALVVRPDLSATALAKHLLMWGTEADMNLDNVIWTLVHEMRISLLFPFILVSVIRYGWRSVMAFWLLSIACNIWIFSRTGEIVPFHVGETVAQSFMATGYYIVFFAAGAWLAVARVEVIAAVVRLPKAVKILLSVLSLWCLPTVMVNQPISGSMIDYMLGLGALGLIAIALSYEQFAGILSRRVSIWMGRISYSLYLVHIPILYVLSQTIGKSWSGIKLSVAVILLSLLGAEIVARTIEFPSIRLGKNLCARFEDRLPRQILPSR